MPRPSTHPSVWYGPAGACQQTMTVARFVPFHPPSCTGLLVLVPYRVPLSSHPDRGQGRSLRRWCVRRHTPPSPHNAGREYRRCAPSVIIPQMAAMRHGRCAHSCSPSPHGAPADAHGPSPRPHGYVLRQQNRVPVAHDARAKGRLEQTRVRGGHAVPPQRVHIGGKQMRAVQSASCDGLPRFIGENFAVNLLLPEHCKRLPLGIVVDA